MAALVGALGAGAARADGDPASDYLIGQKVFLSYDAKIPRASQQKLLAAVQSANAQGFPVKVALIWSSYDLGSVPQLFRNPHYYAHFLDIEDSYWFKEKTRLIVVMPNGLGFAQWKHDPSAGNRMLAGIKVVPTPSGMAAAATNAVVEIARAAGVGVSTKSSAATSAAPPAGPGAGNSRMEIVLAVLLALTLGVTARALIQRRRRVLARSPGKGDASVNHPSSPARRPSRRLYWAVLAAALLAGVALGAAIAVLRSPPAPATPESAKSGPPISWPAGKKRAPGFSLRDENGRPIALKQFRGRPVILTFIDPLCRNLCPLEAKILGRIAASFPVGQRPPIIAVSVNQWADARKNLVEDVQKWSLPSDWHWAIGTPTALARVWKDYSIGVSVLTRTISGTTVHRITHTEASVLVDPKGYERALYLYPFFATDVEQTLRSLARA